MSKNMKIQNRLSEILKKNGHGPFLFLGSGVSRRYLGLEKWDELLRHFCADIKEFEYYLSSSNSDLTETASLMAEDYREFWWSSPSKEEERNKLKHKAISKSSPLKISISEYVKNISSSRFSEENEFYEEILELKKANIDGIITTNWDLFTENLFPDYKVFIGQEELLVSTPQNIGEIYKIHGCCSKPNSLVVTKEDYKQFEETNPYLAAKLVTIFVENPVVFIGYSLYDPNIKSLLSSIVKGIGAKNIKKITNNLIFVQREKSDRPYGIRETVYSLGEVDLPVTVLVTPDFKEIYKALQEVEHKIPVRILRHCKEQIYNLVKETETSERLCVIDFEDLDESSNVDFVVGVGVRDRLMNKGYQAINLVDIFTDVIKSKSDFDPENILTTTIPACEKITKYVPAYKYLKMQGVDTLEKYNQSKYNLRSINEFAIKDFRHKQYQDFFMRECKGMSVNDIAEKYETTKAAILIPFLPWKNIDPKQLSDFINNNLEKVDSKKHRYSTIYRKLICVYDAIVNGWYIS